MKELELTEEDKAKLIEEIDSNTAYGKKQLRNFSLYILIGIIISGITEYWKNGVLTVRMFLGLILVGVFMLMMFSLFFYLSRGTINKLKMDLKKGKKIVGKNRVESINNFNGKITLSNGIKFHVSIFFPEKIRKGDLINYTVSYSNTYQFECIKD